MVFASGFGVEYDEAWAAGSALLQAGDDVVAAGRAGLLLGSSAYGNQRLVDAARRFGDRYEHLLTQGLGEEAGYAGENLHATVRDYRDMDISVPVVFPTTADRDPV